MKIARIDVYQVDLPYPGAYRLSGGRVYQSFDASIVRVVTDTGLEGWGESTPFGPDYIAAHAKGVRAGIDEIAPSVLGLNPLAPDRLNDAMDAALAGHAHAKAPIDVACWDIAGKATGRPVCDLLGGRIAGPVPVISSIGGDSPDVMRAAVARHRVEGFMAHSLKIGAAETEGGPALDAERICACLADRQPGEWFQADANGGMTVEHAVRLVALLPKETDIVIEAPCATWAETLRFRARCPFPIMLDELAQTDADIIQAIRLDACDGIGLKVTKQGGLTAVRRQRDLCAAAGLVTSVQDTWGSAISFSAVLHMAQATPRRMLRAALDVRPLVGVTTAAFDAPLRDGGATAPDAPGLGVTPEMDVLGSPLASYGGKNGSC